jgi:transcriptional regulator with XRE-family HTH domain
VQFAEEVVQKIKQVRAGKGMSQGEVADAIGVSRATLSRWESDNSRFITVGALESIAKCLGVPIAELLPATPVKSEVGQLSVMLTPEQYEIIFLLNRLAPNDRDFILDSARVRAGLPSKTLKGAM